MASLDQSLRRMSLDYVDIFLPSPADPETPLEETMELKRYGAPGKGSVRGNLQL